MRRLFLLIASTLLFGAAASCAVADGVPQGDAAYTVFFDWDQAALSLHARAILAQAGRAAAFGRAARIALASADGDGSGRTYGTILARARLRNLAAELRRDGVAPDRILAARGAVVVRPGTR